MILKLVADVGNTLSVFGIYENNELISRVRLQTSHTRTADEWFALLYPKLKSLNLLEKQFSLLCFASVVPAVNNALEELAEDTLKCPSLKVNFKSFKASS